jgi:hypothetical protein
VYYIMVLGYGDVRKIVTDRKGTPRSFSKTKAIHNFIDSRSFLQERDPIIISAIPQKMERYIMQQLSLTGKVRKLENTGKSI